MLLWPRIPTRWFHAVVPRSGSTHSYPCGRVQNKCQLIYSSRLDDGDVVLVLVLAATENVESTAGGLADTSDMWSDNSIELPCNPQRVILLALTAAAAVVLVLHPELLFLLLLSTPSVTAITPGLWLMTQSLRWRSLSLSGVIDSKIR